MQILRLARDSGLITAEVFETLFARELGTVFQVASAPLDAWCDTVFGRPGVPPDTDAAVDRLAEAVRGFDFVCPSYEGMPFVPRLAALRNRSHSRSRLLLIAHAPGAWALEWALLAPVLAPGDLVIAPSESARQLMLALCPTLSPYLRTIPHPMRPLPEVGTRERRIVSLGRLHPTKLVHRQIEAMAILQKRGIRVRMEIGGPLNEAGTESFHPYARSLQEKIERLGLTEQVELVGPLRDEQSKAGFLSGAAMLVNLSVTVEESFGKAPVEALSVGVPVLATHWDGLVETVGACGELLPVQIVSPGVPDVAAEVVADGIAKLLSAPLDPAACREQAARFAPKESRERYLATAWEAVERIRPSCPDEPEDDVAAAPPAGLLSIAAPLTVISWREALALLDEECDSIRASWSGQPPRPRTDGARLRELVLRGTRPTLEAILSGGDPPLADPSVRAELDPMTDADFLGRVGRVAGRPGLTASRLACLLELRGTGRTALLRAGLNSLRHGGVATSGTSYLAAELEAEDGDLALALRLCEEGIHDAEEGEHAAFRYRQLASLARRHQRPMLAAGPIATWLHRFPDSPDSGPLWLDLAACEAAAGPAHLGAACSAAERARSLLGAHPVVLRLEAMLCSAVACLSAA